MNSYERALKKIEQDQHCANRCCVALGATGPTGPTGPAGGPTGPTAPVS